MNKRLFQKIGLYQVIKDTNAPDNDEFNYSKHYVEFFEYMVNQGASEYNNPDWLRVAIHEQSKKFIDEFRPIFEDNNDDNINGALEKNKCFNNANEYFNALRMKFAGNLLEAIMDAFFNHANVGNGRLQPFTKFESSFGGDDDAAGVDAWLVSADGIRIPVNAKHLAFDGMTKNDAFMKLKANKLDSLKSISRINPSLLIDAMKTPDGVIFTDAAIGRNVKSREFKREQFPDVVVIDESELFKTIGKHDNNIPNIAFWKAAFDDAKNSLLTRN